MEKEAFRTPDLNYIIAEIARHTGDFAIIKKGLSFFYKPKSLCAEKEGFEPSVRLPVRMFSKHVLSASQASLRFLLKIVKNYLKFKTVNLIHFF